MSAKKAIQAISKKGILLVFPINNAKEPASLWSEFYPRTKMRWEWSDDGDDKVAGLWHLMKKLSTQKGIVYSKWLRGRATFFSDELFTSLLAITMQTGLHESGLSRQAKELLEILEADSPISTRQLKKLSELQGRDNEPIFQKSLKELFSRFLIIAYGEVDDGAFPSLAVGSTKLIYENLWRNAQQQKMEESLKIINHFLPASSKTRQFFDKLIVQIKKNSEAEKY